MKKELKKFIDRYEKIIEAEGYDKDRDYCEGCPCRAICNQEEIFWGCSIWEDYMGEDL